MKIKESNIKPGDLVQPIHPVQWFPIDYETMDVWRPKEWMRHCDIYDEDRRPLIYVGMVVKRDRKNCFWMDRTQQGRHMVYYEGNAYFVSPSAWKSIEIIERC